LFANRNGWIHLVVLNGLQVMPKIVFPSKKMFMEKVLATYVNAKDVGHICTTCIVHKFVHHMYFKSIDVGKGTWCVCCGCQFHVQQLIEA